MTAAAQKVTIQVKMKDSKSVVVVDSFDKKLLNQAEKQIKKVIGEIPLLTPEGVGRGMSSNATSSDMFRPVIYRQYLWCCLWLGFCKQTKKVTTYFTSYSYKHMVERWVGEYISNGAFIAAAVNEGIPGKFNMLNPYFAISKRSFIRDEMRQYQIPIVLIRNDLQI